MCIYRLIDAYMYGHIPGCKLIVDLARPRVNDDSGYLVKDAREEMCEDVWERIH